MHDNNVSESGGDTGLVTATFSRRMQVLLAGTAQYVDARIKGKTIRPVCGDTVVVEPIPNEDDWLITAVMPRRNELSRPDSRGRREVLAANIDLLVAMAAPEPRPDWYVVDRYLAAAENMGAKALVVFNKSDLEVTGELTNEVLADYVRSGYQVVRCSATVGHDIEQLRSHLQGNTSIVVGQSGVGKSSVINRLAGAAAQRTAALSGSSGEGRHTTVNSVLLPLPDGGDVIDSPGVRDYAPAIETPPEVIRGFREIQALGQECKFANCRHLREPGCAVKKGVDEGCISERRYESFKRMMTLARELSEKRP